MKILFLLFLSSIAWAEPTNWTVNGSVNQPSSSYTNVGSTLNSHVNGINNFFNGKTQTANDLTARADAHFATIHNYAEAVKSHVQEASRAQPKRDTAGTPQLQSQSFQTQESVDRSIDLRSIPDPVTIPYKFQSYGDNQRELERIYKDLYKIEPKFGKQIKAKELGLESVQAADQFYAEGSNAEGHFLKELAKEFLDIAVGIDPVSGFGRSVYELCYGRNLITGATLSTAERGFAFLGVASAGGAKTIAQTTRALSKVYHGAAGLLKERQAIQAAISHVEPLAEKAGSILSKWQKNHKITAIESAEDFNKKLISHKNPPFQNGSHVVHFETVSQSEFVRVVSDGGKVEGAWLIRKEAIRGLSPNQIANKLNLPKIPAHVVDVTVPSKFPMSRGMTNLNQWEDMVSTVQGQVQYYARDILPASSFKNLRPISQL